MNHSPIQILQSQFGFTSFKPGQLEAITSLLAGEHNLVVMPTGSGKSLIYQLTALFLPGITLVISPLIALMKDQVDSLERHGIPATYLNSALAGNEQSLSLKHLSDGAYRLLYISPERLRNVMFIHALQGLKVSMLIVDEAHCISGWGHDFRPDYLHIAKFRSELGNPLTAALTATATPQVQKDIIRLLGIIDAKSIVTGFNRPNLALEVRYIPNPVERLRCLRSLLISQKSGATLIYTGTRRDAEEISEFASAQTGRRALHYHAGLPTEERTQIQNDFIAGKTSLVVATNAFGMGIDRPDVRQVIHYAMPGSIEAYYQEAGRAGRDDKPAKAVLLYSPDDRALQEWFIETSTVAIKDLLSLFKCLQASGSGRSSTTVDALSVRTGLPDIKVKVGLAELEAAGVIEHQGVDRMNMWFSIHSWDEAQVQSISEHSRQHQKYRTKQLEAMIHYAESNDCRRKIILDYFGDKSKPDAEVCCDNCLARRNAVPPPAKQTSSTTDPLPLIVLDLIRRLKIEVGREKIIRILKGSKAKDILQYGYNKSVYYGRLNGYPARAVAEILDQLIGLRYLKVIGGKYPVLRLTPSGEAAIKKRAEIPLQLSNRIDYPALEQKKAEKAAGGSLQYTMQLLSSGSSVEEVARQRGLAVTTIYSHCARLIAGHQLDVNQVVPGYKLHLIEAAIHQVGSVQLLTPIKAVLPEEVDYNMIRCVVENWKIKGARANTEEDLAMPVDPGERDPVADFLSQAHPRKLAGPWDEGWALGFHSQFTGAKWNRSGVGDLAYNLKYQGDLSAIQQLVEQACKIMSMHTEMTKIDGIVPVPSSTVRANDPVGCFVKALADKLELHYSPIVVKARQTAPQKEMHSMAQKKANVAGAFKLQGAIPGKRILLVDDLFDSGATLEEICQLLRRSGVVLVYVLTLTKTIHSDA